MKLFVISRMGQDCCLFKHKGLEVSTVLKQSERKVDVPEAEVRKYDNAFASRMKSLRDDRGLKRDWVAKQLGVHYNTLKNWELGKAHPGTRELLALSKIYHVEPEDFFRGI
jgi:DNA-binding transcriptional regulator YiaG